MRIAVVGVSMDDDGWKRHQAVSRAHPGGRAACCLATKLGKALVLFRSDSSSKTYSKRR